MIGFASIAGGAPSSTGGMTDHLLTNTLGPEGAKLAAYYGRGMVQDQAMLSLAEGVAAGNIAYSDALSVLMERYVREGGDIGLLDAAEERIGKRLGDLAFRIQEGLQDAPLAVLRPDMHPMVAQGLGIDPEGLLSRDEINALLAGRRADGSPIEGKHYAKERHSIDPKTGEQCISTPIGSYDFCPSPHKSVSVAWAFAEPVEQAQIANAVLESSRDAMRYIAQEVGKARIGKGGQDGTMDGHVAWLEFMHHTSRRVQITMKDGEAAITKDAGFAGDPELHIHNLIPNAVFCEEGRVGSLDTAAIRGFIFEADAYFHARLAQRLRDAGFEVELDQRTGAARLPSVPDEICDLFSKRTRIGESLARQMTAERGEVWDELTQDQREARMKASIQDLDQKVRGGKDDVANVESWKRQAKDRGWERDTFQLYGPPLPPIEPEQKIRLAYETALPFLSDKFEHRAVLTHWDARVAAARGLVHAGIDGLEDIDAVTRLMRKEGVMQAGTKTPLLWGAEEGQRYTSITTGLHEAEEREFISLAQAAAADRHGALPAKLLEQKIAESGLDLSGDHGRAQRAVMDHLGTGGQFGLALGAAGSGKTTMLQPLVAAWREQGRAVFGASLAWRQAEALTEAGIDQHNVKAFSVLISGLQDGSIKIGRNDVVAIDEASLLGTRQGLELLRLRAVHGFRIVALGDDRQAGAIEAGSTINLTRRALGAENVPEIVTTVRQQTERERTIVGLLRQGKAAEALTMKRADGTAEMVHGGYDQVIDRVAKLYRERLTTTGEAPTISAPTNMDAHRISEAVRAVRRDLGELGPDVRTVNALDGERQYRLALAKGDRVRLFESTGASFGQGRGGSIGRNGSVLEVVAADDRGLTLRNKSGRVGVVAWDSLADKRTGRIKLAYGDAMTIHTAQGSTTKEHIFALPSGSQAVEGLLAYSAGTRHRRTNYLLTSETAEHAAVRKSRPLNDTNEITANDKWANVARTLSRQPEKDSAVSLIERVSQIRRGSVQTFQQVLRQTEAAKASHQPPSQGHIIVMRRKLEQRLKPVVQKAMQIPREIKQRAAEIAHTQRATHERRGPRIPM